MNGAVKVVLSVMAMTAVMVHCVLAGGNSQESGGSSSSSDDNGPRSVGPMLSKDACRCTSRYGTNYCTGRTGILSIGCSESNLFLQCTNAVCALQACPIGTVWDASTSTCAVCPAGLHPDIRNRRCVCNQYTTWNATSLQCGPCPAGATNLPDSCGCSRGLVLNRVQNACLPCPATATYSDGTCKCFDTTLFYNAATGSCAACPGTLAQYPNARRPVCLCSGAPVIFDRKTVSCFTCPAGTTAIINPNSENGDFCNCNMYGAKFNQATGCACPIGQTANTVLNICQVSVVPVPVPVPNPVAPAVQP